MVVLVFGVAAYLKIRWEALYSSLWRKEFHFVGFQAESCFAECLYLNKYLSSQKYWQGNENGQCPPHWMGIDGTVTELWQSRRNKLKYTAWWCNGVRRLRPWLSALNSSHHPEGAMTPDLQAVSSVKWGKGWVWWSLNTKVLNAVDVYQPVRMFSLALKQTVENIRKV